MGTPYYLTPNEQLDPIQFGTINLFDTQLPSNNYVEQADGIWDELVTGTSDTLNKAGDYVWNAATSTWDKAKEIIPNTINGILDFVGSILKRPFEFFQNNLLMGIGILLLLVWVIAKSGILKQAAAFV